VLWTNRSHALADSLTALSARLRSAPERRDLTKVERSFQRYLTLAATPTDAGLRLRPATASQIRGLRAAADRVARSIRRLGEAIDQSARHAQAQAAALEERTWRTVLLALPLSGLLALVLSFVIALRATRVLRRLATASSLLAQGALKDPVTVDRSDELGQL